MGPKGFLYMGLLVASFLLISSALAARDLAETTIDQQHRPTTEMKGLGDAKYQYGGYGAYPGGGRGGGYGAYPGGGGKGGYGGYPGGGNGGYGGYSGGGNGVGLPGYGQFPGRGGYYPNGC